MRTHSCAIKTVIYLASYLEPHSKYVEGDPVTYYAFGFDARPDGGLHDIIATCDTLDDAKTALEREAPNHAYWQDYQGHIAVIEDNQFKIVLYYAALLVGNVYGGKIKQQVWSETRDGLMVILKQVR
jgi:hypothetical protein